MLIHSPKCPSCKRELTWQDLRGHFQCRNCGVQLTSNYYRVMFFTLVILPFPFIFLVSAGGIAVILIGGAVLMALSVWILSKFIDVRRG